MVARTSREIWWERNTRAQKPRSNNLPNGLSGAHACALTRPTCHKAAVPRNNLAIEPVSERVRAATAARTFFYLDFCDFPLESYIWKQIRFVISFLSFL